MELLSVIHSSLSRVYVHREPLGLVCHERLGSVALYFLLISLHFSEGEMTQSWPVDRLDQFTKAAADSLDVFKTHVFGNFVWLSAHTRQTELAVQFGCMQSTMHFQQETND